MASNYNFIPETGKKEPAKVGTSVHYALEHFVRNVYMLKTHEWGDLDHLLELYHQGYMETFGSASKSSKEYKDGLALTKKWHARTDLTGWEIDNVEEKKRVPIGSTGIKLTYIFDRVEKRITESGKRVVRVSDYKSIRRQYNHAELIDNLQVRIYALAAAIEYKEWAPDEIWVHLDLLRHDDIGVRISHEQNVETWQYLLDTARLIQGTEEDQVEYTLGPGCTYCPIKSSCPKVLKNIEHGGILALGGDLEAIVLLREQVTGQEKALDLLGAQLDEMLLAEAKNRDVTSYEVLGRPIKIKTTSRRALSDTSLAAKIIGPELMATVGKLGIGDVEKVIASGVLDEDQISQLEGLIVKNFSAARAELQPVPPLKKGK